MSTATTQVTIDTLPQGPAPMPAPAPHFPDALHAAVWRNWDFVDVPHLARTLHGTHEQINDIARSMGLPPQRNITRDERHRNYMSILRRNWHLLPYGQLCDLLEWDAAEMLYSLNEDDFMWIKLGGYKPRCAPVHYREPDEKTRAKAHAMRDLLNKHVGSALAAPAEPLFGFIDELKHMPTGQPQPQPEGAFQVRMCYPYFLRFGDPLNQPGVEDVPDGYLRQLHSLGVNAIWFQGVLNKLAPWKLAPSLSEGWERRLANLNRLVERCAKYGIKVMMYLNEPRAMPHSFFDAHPDLRGVQETADRATYSPDVTALCTSTPEVQDFISGSVRHIFQQVPGLGGILTITFSENLTNCYSREYESTKPDEYALRSIQTDAPRRVDKACPRCKARGPEVVNAEILSLYDQGMKQAGSDGKLLWYVWSTPDDWMPGMIDRVPQDTWVLCVSEWGKEFTRGDYTGKVNEYSISVIGPSERSLRHWSLARKRGLRTAAKLQVGTSFEMFLVPWLSATYRVAQHMANVADEGVDGVMLGWSLGGWPAPNLAIAAEMGKRPTPSVDDAIRAVAVKCFGEGPAAQIIAAWKLLSDAFGEFPMDISTVYNAPQCLGPANLLYASPTGLPATMTTYPFDDLDGWRGGYSAETYQKQFEKLASGWQQGVDVLAALFRQNPTPEIEREYRVAEACGLCFWSTANQIKYIRQRDSDLRACAEILRDEIRLAARMFELCSQDSRLGFEATMQYGYARFDMAEKILNCAHLLSQIRQEA